MGGLCSPSYIYIVPFEYIFVAMVGGGVFGLPLFIYDD